MKIPPTVVNYCQLMLVLILTAVHWRYFCIFMVFGAKITVRRVFLFFFGYKLNNTWDLTKIKK